jgi:sulfur carrier protein
VIVIVNGQPQEVPSGATVRSLINALPGAPEGRGVAVALEGEVVPRTTWPSTGLVDGAHVEIVVAVQGG